MQNTAAIAAGQSIRSVRELAGLTISETAQLIGGSAGYLSQVETGKASSVSARYVANTISALCAFMTDPATPRRPSVAVAPADPAPAKEAA